MERRTEAFRINEGTINGLKPGTNYAIIASGVRNGNKGKSHPYIFPWTVPNAVDVATITTNTRVDVNANHQVDIYFDPPKVGGHDSFKLVLREKSVKESDCSETNCPERIVEKPKSGASEIGGTYDGKYAATYDGLKPSTLYLVKIYTYRGGNDAVTRDIEFRTDRAVPPRNLRQVDVGTSSATIQFDGSPDAESYQVEVVHIVHDDDHTKNIVFNNEIAGTEDSVTITNLDPGNHYVMTISSIANNQDGTQSKDLGFWTRPAVVQELMVTFGTIQIQVAFEPAPGGVDYYDITIAPVSDPTNPVDVRQLKKNEYLIFTSKSTHLAPNEEYVITVITIRGEKENSIKTEGRMKPSPVPKIISAYVDQKSNLKCTWQLQGNYQDNTFFHVQVVDESDKSVIPIDQNDVTRKELSRQNFDSTRHYILRVRTKLRNVWSEWVEKRIKCSNCPDKNAKPVDPLDPMDPGDQTVEEWEIRQTNAAGASPDGVSHVNFTRICDNVNSPVDLVFILDSSNSVTRPNFNVMVQWLRKLLHQMKIGEDAAHVGVALFNNMFRNIFTLNQYDDSHNMITQINGMEYKGRGTKIAKALQQAIKFQISPENGLRTDVPIHLYLLTDGDDESTLDVRLQADTLRKELPQLTITAIGIGLNVNTEQLFAMASEPKHKNLFLLESYQFLEKQMTDIIFHHAGCNVPNPFKATSPDLPVPPTNNPEIDSSSKPAAPEPLSIKGEKKLQAGVITVTMNKSRTKKVIHEVQLEQINPSTKELMERFTKDGVVDREVKFTALPLGFEYYARVRVRTKSKPSTYSDWKYWKDFVHLDPPLIKDTDIAVNKTSAKITLTFDQMAGHADVFEIRAIKMPERKGGPQIIKEIDTADEAYVADDGAYTVTFNTDDNLQPESTYKLLVTPISGNKRGEETQLQVEMPKMGRSRIIDLNEVGESSVLWRITLPDGADDIEVNVRSYPSSDGTSVGEVRFEDDGAYRIEGLEPNSQFKLVARPFRNGPNGRFYGSETEELFWTRPASILCSEIKNETESTRISIVWRAVEYMDLASSKYSLILYEVNKDNTSARRVTVRETTNTRYTFQNANDDIMIVPETRY